MQTDTPVAVNAVVGTVLLLSVAILEGARCSTSGLSTVDIEAFEYSHFKLKNPSLTTEFFKLRR